VLTKTKLLLIANPLKTLASL